LIGLVKGVIKYTFYNISVTS